MMMVMTMAHACLLKLDVWRDRWRVMQQHQQPTSQIHSVGSRHSKQICQLPNSYQESFPKTLISLASTALYLCQTITSRSTSSCRTSPASFLQLHPHSINPSLSNPSKIIFSCTCSLSSIITICLSEPRSLRFLYSVICRALLLSPSFSFFLARSNS